MVQVRIAAYFILCHTAPHSNHFLFKVFLMKQILPHVLITLGMITSAHGLTLRTAREQAQTQRPLLKAHEQGVSSSTHSARQALAAYLPQLSSSHTSSFTQEHSTVNKSTIHSVCMESSLSLVQMGHTFNIKLHVKPLNALATFLRGHRIVFAMRLFMHFSMHGSCKKSDSQSIISNSMFSANRHV